MDRRGWKVLHLAAHGAVDFATYDGPVTGMVLGEGLFLTPATIRQLPVVPEVVFLNCCHLGRMDASAEQRAGARYPELAANLATAFIRLGSRAVVAAGWAVDDMAARIFAEKVFEGLLGGEPFGTAVHVARKAVYEQHPTTNTWGAYQCYGDPAYRLDPRRSGDGPGDAEGLYAHPTEARVAIEDVICDAQTMVVRDAAELEARLDAIWKRVPEDWRARPELLAVFGEACGELGRLDRAIECYTQAIAAEKALAQVRTVEQLANLRARRAVLGKVDDPSAEIRIAIDALEDLMALVRGRNDAKPLLPETAERLSLLGSCYKRLAQVETRTAERDRALVQMSSYYRRAHARSQEQGKLDPYPLLNWLLAEQLLAVRKPNHQPPPDLDLWLSKAEETARMADGGEPGFWNAVTLADVVIGRALASGKLIEPESQKDVIEAYLRPWRRGASRLKFDSVLEQMEFVAEVLREGPASSKAARAGLVKALRSIIDHLRAATKVR
jgi:tetratricopeptide (TPR) repeat protein